MCSLLSCFTSHHSLPHKTAKSTLSRLNASPAEKAARQTRLATAVRTVLECIGEDPDREGLLRTPERYAQALMWMTKGYEDRLAGSYPHFCHPSTPNNLFYPDVINGAVFAEDHDEMVLVRDIDISSLCEHHLVPFTGKVRPTFPRPPLPTTWPLTASPPLCSADCHSIYTKQACFGYLQTRTHRRDIQPTSSGPRAPYEADCSLRTGGYQTTWGRSRHGGYVRPVSIAAAISLMCPRPTSYAPPPLSHPAMFLPPSCLFLYKAIYA